MKRGDNHGALRGAGGIIRATRDEEMAAYDALPEEVRKVLQENPTKPTALNVRTKIANFMYDHPGATVNDWCRAVRTSIERQALPFLYKQWPGRHPNARS